MPALIAEGRQAEAGEVLAWTVGAATRRGGLGVRLPTATLDGLPTQRLEGLGLEVRTVKGLGAPSVEVRLRSEA